MRKITNGEESNQYYEMINKCIDEYIIDNKIKPSNLKNYFKTASKLESFLKKAKLDDVEGIKRIVHDVIEDRHAAEVDGIIKFENFILNEDLGNISIKESNINHEKILADLYHSSIGHINVVNNKEHKYLIKDFGEEKNIIIYSKEDIEDFKKIIIPILVEKAKSESIFLKKIDVGLESKKQIKCGISFLIKDIVSDEKLNKIVLNKLQEKRVLGILSSFMNNSDITSVGKIYKYSKNFKGYHIWELKDAT